MGGSTPATHQLVQQMLAQDFTALVWTQVVVHLPPTKCSNKCWPRTLYCLPMDMGGSTPATHQLVQQMLAQDFTALVWTQVVVHLPPTNWSNKR